MTWFECYMAVMIGVAAFLILGDAPRLQPAADPSAELATQVDTIEQHLDRLEHRLDELRP